MGLQRSINLSHICGFLWFLNPLAAALVLAGWLAGCLWAAAGAPVFSFRVSFFCCFFWFLVLGFGGFFFLSFRASFGSLQPPMVDGGPRFVSVIFFHVFRVHDLMIPDNC